MEGETEGLISPLASASFEIKHYIRHLIAHLYRNRQNLLYAQCSAVEQRYYESKQEWLA